MSEKPKVQVTKEEREVLEEASRGSVVPMKSLVGEFKSLIQKKLLEHKGNNKYTASKLGLYVLTGTVPVEEVPPSAKEKAGNTRTPQARKRPPKPKRSAKELDVEYSKKYPHYVKGSLSETPEKGIGKRTAEIKCTTKGCGKHRTVYTSDIFQVKMCNECRDGVEAKRMKDTLTELSKRKKAA